VTQGKWEGKKSGLGFRKSCKTKLVVWILGERLVCGGMSSESYYRGPHKEPAALKQQ